MSFFDEGDEPRTRVARPRRPAPQATDETPDQQTLLVRRGVAAGAGLLVLILLVLGVNGCLNSRKERQLKDYNRDVTAVMTASDDQVGKPFFQLLAEGGRSPLDLQTEVNALRVEAEQQLGRARKFGVPGEMKAAQQNLLLTLNLRSGALARIADKLPGALGREQAEEAIQGIAGQMQAFLASDVVYSQRVIPFIGESLDGAEIGGQTIVTSQFLQNLGWLNPPTVAGRLKVQIRKTGPNGEPAPGLHGHGLVSVTAGDTVLQPSPAANRIAAATSVSFEVKFANQGENDEVDVEVKIRVRGAGDPITVEKTVDQTKQGAEATVQIPLGQAPPIGTPVTIEVEVAKVPGEKKTDNNKQSYTAIFTR